METKSDMDTSSTQKLVLEIYSKMRGHFGHAHWWPGDSPFEVIVGAILTQNTAWTNVTKAIANLKEAGIFSVEAMVQVPESRLAPLIRPSGYFNQKAKKLKGFFLWLKERYDGDLERMSRVRLPTLRKELLALNGVGPETADSILLYAANKTTFVIDAYTRRIFSRHGLTAPDASYEWMKSWFEVHLPRRQGLFNDYHAQIVNVGKDFCQKQPRCERCPLKFLFGLPGLSPSVADYKAVRRNNL